MRILAIETSCDDTSVALVECKGTLRPIRQAHGKPAQGNNLRFQVIKNIVSSQIAVHIPFGGVVPNLAKREHIKNLPKVLKQLITYNKQLITDIDAIAVTVGPGLEPALWTGIEFAKDLAKKWNKPLLGANHMEGHLFSNWLTNSDKRQATNKERKVQFPAVALVVSGGHTILLAMQSMTKWKKLGETRDDAAGEAFDKVARMLGLPYPGGPQIAKLALRQAQGKHPQGTIDFPQPMRNHANYDFSFSGVKTSVLYYIRDKVEATGDKLTQKEKADIAASFERAVTDVLTYKTERAVREYGAKSILLCGGVAANQWLRKKLKSAAHSAGIDFFAPENEYNTDNAAMIAAAAYIGHLQKKKHRMVAQSNLTL